MVISNSHCPESKQAVEWDEHTKCVRDHEHVFCFNAEVFLDVPETEGRCDGACGLRETEVCYFEEGKGYNIVLDDGDQCSSGIQTVGKEEEGNQVQEGLRKMSDLAKCKEDLLPANCQIIASFGNLRSRSRLLEEKPPNPKDNPIWEC